MLRIVTVGFVTDVRHWRAVVTTVVTREERNNPSLPGLSTGLFCWAETGRPIRSFRIL